jgi:14-3-3 protein epsilon
MTDVNYTKNIYLARVAEKADCHEDTIKIMEDLIKTKENDLNLEERNILSSAYKNLVSSRRSAWRSINAVEIKEKNSNSKLVQLITDLKLTLEKELKDLCNNILKILNEYLIRKAKDNESKIFYLKMRSDYFRYLSEFEIDEKKTENIDNALNSYKQATELAVKLPTTHPMKLGLALNYSVFYYEILNDKQTAFKIASEIFNMANNQLEKTEENQYKDSLAILQLLKENIELWKIKEEIKEDVNQ